MTCIVGISDGYSVYMGTDSCMSSPQLTYSLSKDFSKLFTIKDFLFGLAYDYRVGQIIKNNFVPPKQKFGESDQSYLCTSFIDEFINTLEKKGSCHYQNGTRDTKGAFLLGYKGKLYEIATNFQIVENVDNYKAIGSGYQYALGSLFTTNGESPGLRLEKALLSSAYFSPFVAPPFLYKTV